jgi:hypothetical protein
LSSKQNLPCLLLLGASAAPAASTADALEQHTYKVVVVTSDVRGAGTDADISMVMHGSKGDAGPLKLDNSANNFERGQTDTFFVKVRSSLVHLTSIPYISFSGL